MKNAQLQLRNIMAGIKVKDLEGKRCYIGAREVLIDVGLARASMFADSPKRIKEGWLDCNGWPIDHNPFDDPRYDWYGETRPIYWATRRIKGGMYELRIDKPFAAWHREIEVEREAEANPTLTPVSYLEWVETLAVGALAFKFAAQGYHNNNPRRYHLSKHHEIAQLIDRAIEAAKTSIVVTGKVNRPFEIINGGAGKQKEH